MVVPSFVRVQTVSLESFYIECIEQNKVKQTQYYDHSNVIGFKIDSRFLLDHKDCEIDLGCLEAAINGFDADKVHNDKVKLAREAKDIVDFLTNKSLPAVYCRGWAILICGLTGKVSTVELVTEKLYVSVPQFQFTFPSKISGLSSFLETLEILSTVIAMMEQTAQETKNIMNSVDLFRSPFTNHMFDPSTSTSPLSGDYYKHKVPTYYSPPQKDHLYAVLPEHSMYKEDRLFSDIMIDMKTIENASTSTNQRKKRKSTNVPNDKG